jgi:hypothetical protein
MGTLRRTTVAASPLDNPAEVEAWPMRSASITAGGALLLMAALGPFGYLVAVEGLVTPGDAARTAADITASTGLFRFGILAMFGVVALDVVVAWALYRVFLPAGGALTGLAAAFRLVYAGVYLVAISHLVGVPGLLGSEDQHAVLGTEQVHAQALLRIETFADVFSAGLLLFGLHLLLIGYLAYRSGFVPRWLGALLAVAGLGYLFDSVASVLTGGGAPEVAGFTFIGELVLAVWLLAKAFTLPVPAHLRERGATR